MCRELHINFFDGNFCTLPTPVQYVHFIHEGVPTTMSSTTDTTRCLFAVGYTYQSFGRRPEYCYCSAILVTCPRHTGKEATQYY